MAIRNRYTLAIIISFALTVGFILYDSYKITSSSGAFPKSELAINENANIAHGTSATPKPTTPQPTTPQPTTPKPATPKPTTKISIPHVTTQPGPYITFVVLTGDLFKETRTKAIRETWAKRAVAKGWRVFYYSETDMGSPNDTIPTHEQDKSSFGNDRKQWRAWGHAKEEEPTSTWYIKVDDDAYVHVDRLERTLANLKPNGIRVYGRCDNFTWEPKPFCDGGSAIIMTREALVAMNKWYLQGKCKDTGHNDLSTSWCFVDNGIILTPIPGLHGEPPASWNELSTDVTWHHLDPDGLRRVDNVFFYK